MKNKNTTKRKRVKSLLFPPSPARTAWENRRRLIFDPLVATSQLDLISTTGTQKNFLVFVLLNTVLKISQTCNEIGLGLGIRPKISFGTSRSKTNLTNSILKSFPFTLKTKRLENDRKSSTNPLFPVGHISLVLVSPFSLTSDFFMST